MSKVTVDISISLDGFVAGPNPTLEEPLGEGGERLHDWIVATRPWRESHGLSGGETGIDADVVAELLGKVGATVMGRRMFSGGAGRGSTIRTQTVGGERIRRSITLSSCSPITRGIPSPNRAEPRSRSLPAASKLLSSKHAPQPATRRSRSPAVRTRSSST